VRSGSDLNGCKEKGSWEAPYFCGKPQDNGLTPIKDAALRTRAGDAACYASALSGEAFDKDDNPVCTDGLPGYQA
jgi:hypothetical protein